MTRSGATLILGPPKMLGLLAGKLTSEVRDLGFCQEDGADTGQGDSVTDQFGHALHTVDLVAGVTTLTAVGSGRSDNRLGVEASQERGLNPEHFGHLADRVERCVRIVDGR